MPSFKNPITNQIEDIIELEGGELRFGEYPLMPVNASENIISLTGATHVVAINYDTKWYCHLRGQKGTFFVAEMVDNLSHEVNISEDISIIMYPDGIFAIKHKEKDGSPEKIVYEQDTKVIKDLINTGYNHHTRFIEPSLINLKYDTSKGEKIGKQNILHIANAFNLEAEINIEKRGDKFFIYVGRDVKDIEVMPISEDMKERSKTSANYQMSLPKSLNNNQIITTLLHMDWDAKIFWRAEQLAELESEAEATHAIFTDNQSILFYKENDKITIKSGLDPDKEESNPESPISKEDVDELIKKTKQAYKEIVEQKKPKSFLEEALSSAKELMVKVGESISTSKKPRSPKW